MITEAAVLEALAELGTTSSEIAAKLEAAGVKGHRMRACNCPIAVYLERRFGVPFACNDVVTFAGALSMRMPAPVFNFIRAFDQGRYPHLEATRLCMKDLEAT